MGKFDHLVPPSASKPLLEYVESTDTKELLLPTGHIGLSVSSKSHRQLWPVVADWLRPRSQLDETSNESGTGSTTTTSRSSGRTGGRKKSKSKSKPKSKKKSGARKSKSRSKKK
jgi:polyhydroxyalkanoate synthase